MKPIRKAVRTFLINDNKVIVIKYKTNKNMNYYDIPGGKIEEGETPEEALKREILEELDTEIRVGDLIDTIEYDYPTFHLSMDCFWAKIVAGNLELIEAAAAKWLTKETLDSEHSRFTFDEL